MKPKMQIIFLDPKNLTPYANNAAEHPIEQVDKIAGQIAAFGFDQPIVVDKDHVIIKGHGRREAALRLGLTEVPVVVANHLSEYEAKAARLGDNQVATLKKFNTEKLRLELGTLNRQNFDLKLTGFELKPIEDLLNVGEVKPEKISTVKNGPAAEKPEPAPVKDVSLDDGLVSPDGGDVDHNLDDQFIVTITCPDEASMKSLYEELSSRNLDVKLIT